jgi:hypothetical protein
MGRTGMSSVRTDAHFYSPADGLSETHALVISRNLSDATDNSVTATKSAVEVFLRRGFRWDHTIRMTSLVTEPQTNGHYQPIWKLLEYIRISKVCLRFLIFKQNSGSMYVLVICETIIVPLSRIIINFLICIVRGGVQLGPLGTAATNMTSMPSPGDYNGETDGIIGRGNRNTRRKPAPVPLSKPQTPTCCPDANPGRRGGKPATNRLSYGTATFKVG